MSSRLQTAAALAYPSFRRLQVARLLLVLALEMQSVALGWHIYEITERALSLGLLGLAQVIPVLGFSLLGGHVADRFDRRRVLMACYALLGVASLGFAWIATLPTFPVEAMYAVAALMGTARAFAGPSGQALVPDLVVEKDFPNAVTWSALVHRVGTLAGPALGGVVYGLVQSPARVYLACGAMALTSAALLGFVRYARTTPERAREISVATLLAGIKYVRQRRVILGSISLDLFAVLFGGATALLPIFARDILNVGPTGLGLLRAAPGVGAAIVAVWLARFPLQRRAGVTMLTCVAIFGVATIVFGLSTNFALSLFALVVTGAADMVSVFVRLTLVQLATPQSMRGRVSAVNMLFISASNELGEFESGVTAALFGTVPAVVLGGLGTILVVAAWTKLFPQLVRIERVEDEKPDTV